LGSAGGVSDETPTPCHPARLPTHEATPIDPSPRRLEAGDAAHVTRSFDAIVVGSGPGGATVARELSRRGWKVLILERGGKAPVTGSMAQTLRELWMPRRSLFLTDRLLAVLRGVTVGGSSIYFFGTAWEPPYQRFDKRGINIRAEVEQARRELRVAPLPPELMGPKARRIMNSAIELGYDWKPLPKYFDQDRLQGSPMGSYGVPTYEAKWNARVFVEEAVSLGATLLTGATARRVLTADGVATGVEFDHQGRTQTALASNIVVAAGGIGSPILLRASGLEDAGRSFFCDPVVLVIGSLPGLGSGQELPMTAGLLVEDEGYTLTDVSLPRWMLSIITAEVGRIDKLPSYRRAAAIMVEISDGLDGRITPRGGIRKPLTPADRQQLARGTERARRILANAGARGLFRSWVLAAQPGGTVPIGRLLDRDLQTEIRNLFVCDASVIPDPWGLPPSLTLIGLGKRLAAHLDARARRARGDGGPEAGAPVGGW
jgi:choline dehydrogenase-like flavoprotein